MDTSMLHLDHMIREGFRGEALRRFYSEATPTTVSEATRKHEAACTEEQYQVAKALRRRDLWIPVGTTDVLAKNWRHITRLDTEAEEILLRMST